MDSDSTLLLLGIAPRGTACHRAVRVGRVTGLVAIPSRSVRLPAAALRLPEPLEFGGLADVRAWLVARESRLAAALRVLSGCREVGLELREDIPRHAAWLRARDGGLAGGASATPARAARRALIARRLEAIMASEARAAVLPAPGPGPKTWAIAVPDTAVQRLRRALESEAWKLRGTGLTLHLRPQGESAELMGAILQDG
jgi:hypothetical protein